MKRPRSVVLFAACSSALLACPAEAQRRELFSALEEYRPAAVRPVDEALVRREVLPVARRLWRGSGNCREEFRVLDAAYGAYTERGMAQRAVLYRFCETGHDFAKGGIAILQAGRVVAHVTIENAEPDGIRRAPDVDRNGAAEVMLVDHALHQGESSVVLSLLQLVPGGVQAMGSFGVYSDDLGTRAPVRGAEATVLFVTSARRPVFEAESYESRPGSRARWIGSEKLHRVEPQPDRTTYRRVR